VPGAFQQRPRLLWSVTQTGNVTNERVAGITGQNPREMNDAYTVGYFTIRITTKINLALTGLRIYGAMHVNGFPVVGKLTEALISTIIDLPVNHGIVRAPAMKDSDGTPPGRPIILPPLLMLEYDTGTPGGSPNLTFIVEACLIGPVILGAH
jgi:hypothetical protein